MTLGIYCFLRNALTYDYPFKESIRSYYAVADEIVIAECFSDKDDTYLQLLELQLEMPKLKIIRCNWVTNWKGLSAIANAAAACLTTDLKWQIQGDEVIHEKDYPEIERLKRGDFQEGKDCFTTNYHHFLGNYETEFPFVYQCIRRIYLATSPWLLSGDACQLEGGKSSNVAKTSISVFHYGKVHEGGVGFRKEVDFQALYTDIGFPDPKLALMKEKFSEEFCDYIFLFEDAIRKKEIWIFDGTHPSTMRERIKLFKDSGWDQFISRMSSGLEIKKKDRSKSEC